jgi:hypothetical protein
MRRFVWFTSLLVFLGAAVSSPAYCWDKYAHMVVCQIAYDRLTPVAKTQVGLLLTEVNQRPDVVEMGTDLAPYTLVTIGAWMDDLKSKDRKYNRWHYIDLPCTPNPTAKDVDDFDAVPGNTPNAVTVIEDCIKTLRDPTSSLDSRTRSFAFLTHLVGDVHQPLHAVGRDRGGNDYKIDTMPAFDPTWKITNLHAFWDNAYRYDSVDGKVAVVEPELDEPRPQSLDSSSVKRFADRIARQYLPRDKATLTDTDPAAWAAESERIACTFAFPTVETTSLPSEYVHEAHDIACQRLALAGYRLGNLLNDIFGATNVPP